MRAMRKAAAILVATLFGLIGLYFAAWGAAGLIHLFAALANGAIPSDWTGRLVLRSEDPNQFWFKLISGAAVDFAAWTLAAIVFLPVRAYLQTQCGQERANDRGQ
jgi:anti-sigma factor RsiW